MRVCEVDGCDNEHEARGFCVRHYGIWRRKGDPLWTIRPEPDRFWEKVDKKGPLTARLGRCWVWTAGTFPTGYGAFSLRESANAVAYAHRYAWEQSHPPLPRGKTWTLDHLCHNADLTCPGGSTCPHRRCVNPRHLELVTRGENIRRANAKHRAK